MVDDNMKKSSYLRAEVVRNALGERILSNQLKAGDVLSESWVAKEFGVSRTPAREALRHLAALGLVELRPNRRPIVAQLTIRDVLELFEMMGELEASCARLAARRRTEDVIDAMRSHNEECAEAAKANDSGLYYNVNEKFHECIYRAAGNTLLERDVLLLRNRMRLLRNAQGAVPGRLANSYDEHRRLISAIEDREEDFAAEIMRKHLQAQGETLRELLMRINTDRLDGDRGSSGERGAADVDLSGSVEDQPLHRAGKGAV
ncbi:GntR family transcriptional regulator [Roseovarius sp. MMSF_3350]|uniref:GntR family transcriptional regulator n=1 Tax=Roseovarius sp. MMSF_3350 TaxID=3046706 RepID=UPI00273D4C1C|nr:GntR family transcriptional regulator [Roseovarius sp. MMSF_3350]